MPTADIRPATRHASGVQATLGQVKAGPQISYRAQLHDGTRIEPHAWLEVIWNFESSNDVVDFGGTLAGPRRSAVALKPASGLGWPKA